MYLHYMVIHVDDDMQSCVKSDHMTTLVLL